MGGRKVSPVENCKERNFSWHPFMGRELVRYKTEVDAVTF